MQRYMDVVHQASVLHADGHLDQAAFLYEHLLGAAPNDSVVMYMLGTLYSQQARFGSAIILLQTAVSESPELDAAWHNLGVAYRNEGHIKLAREAYQKCLDVNGKNPEALAMMAGTFVNTGAPEEGIEWADKSLALEPDNPHALNQKSLCLLELGRYEEAWPIYGNRFKLPNMSCSVRAFECPEWDGKPVGKLAVHGEQGLGDEILFMSCFGDIAGAEEVVIECEPRLKKVFKRSFGVKCYGTHDEMIKAEKDIDAFIPMGGLPGLFRHKIEDFPRKAYLKASPAKVKNYRKRLEKLGDGPYVGIAWHGGTKGTHQELRNPSLDLWKWVIDAAKMTGTATFISLQYGEHGLTQAEELGITHWPKAVDDLDDFAALIEACDLVVSVCQTAIHFAGGLGKECWCLTPSQPAWRYGIQGPMHWYGSVELLRQKGMEWKPVFEEVGIRLGDLAK